MCPLYLRNIVTKVSIAKYGPNSSFQISDHYSLVLYTQIQYCWSPNSTSNPLHFHFISTSNPLRFHFQFPLPISFPLALPFYSSFNFHFIPTSFSKINFLFQYLLHFQHRNLVSPTVFQVFFCCLFLFPPPLFFRFRFFSVTEF